MRTNQPLPRSTRFRRALRKLRDWFRREPESPEDPHAYVTAPKKPRPGSFSASAVAEPPEE